MIPLFNKFNIIIYKIFYLNNLIINAINLYSIILKCYYIKARKKASDNKNFHPYFSKKIVDNHK